MNEVFMRALAAAARAFADEIEQGLVARPEETAGGLLAGSAASMFEVLGSIARINDDHGRGASDEEVRAIARRAGMDPRGMAGYYSARLLEKRDGGRWVSADGRERLGRLQALRGVVILGPGQDSGTTPDSTPADTGQATPPDPVHTPAQTTTTSKHRPASGRRNRKEPPA
jgi:hypothetical protein